MKKGLILALAIFLAACSNQNRLSNGQLIGTIGGGIIGAYVGSQFGGGAGSLLWMVTGAAVGGAAGFAFGDSLIPSDRAKFEKSTKTAMDHIQDGQVYSWTNPDTGVAGTIKPTRTYYAGDGQLCRDFDATIAASEGIGRSKGRACKISADAWFVDGTA